MKLNKIINTYKDICLCDLIKKINIPRLHMIYSYKMYLYQIENNLLKKLGEISDLKNEKIIKKIVDDFIDLVFNSRDIGDYINCEFISKIIEQYKYIIKYIPKEDVKEYFENYINGLVNFYTDN